MVSPLRSAARRPAAAHSAAPRRPPAGGPGFVSPSAGWQWSQPQLDAYTSATFTAQLHMDTMPPDRALVALAQASASGLDTPIIESGGGLVIDPTLGPATAPFTPGATT